MNELVEIVSERNGVPITTSRKIAQAFEKEHKNVLRDIENILIDDEFSRLNFELSNYKSRGKRYPEYILTKNGFTLLVMGYTGEKAMKFKEAYIRQFNQMEELLKGKLIEREKGIAVRQSLTKAIQQSGEDERTHGHAYSLYTDLIYKAVFGKNTKQLREEYRITKQDNLRDFFAQEELAKVKSVEMVVSGLVDCGWGYDDVKDFITNSTKKLIAA